MEFGRNFLKARSSRGIDQKDAASLLNITPGFLSRVENNKQKPSIDLIMKASEVYGVKPGFFFDSPDEINIENLASQKNLGFINDLESLSNEEMKERYMIQLDGKELTDRELKGIMAYLRSLRSIDD